VTDDYSGHNIPKQEPAPNNHDHWWRVKAQDNAGNWETGVFVWTFKTVKHLNFYIAKNVDRPPTGIKKLGQLLI